MSRPVAHRRRLTGLTRGIVYAVPISLLLWVPVVVVVVWVVSR